MMVDNKKGKKLRKDCKPVVICECECIVHVGDGVGEGCAIVDIVIRFHPEGNRQSVEGSVDGQGGVVDSERREGCWEVHLVMRIQLCGHHQQSIDDDSLHVRY